jgi:hypothetical protein
MRPLCPKFSLPALLVALASAAGPLLAQDLTVSGRVTTSNDGAPRGGVSVQIKGTNSGVLTTSTGNYSIDLRSASDTLVFTFLGFVSQEVPVDGQEVIDVTLAQSVLLLDQIIIQGYSAPPGLQVPRSTCARTYSPMPGSAYDPRWQAENPELARLMFPNCTRPSVQYRLVPPTPSTTPVPPAN